MNNRALWGLILGFAALHLLLAALLPLVEDEAYYRLWASAPALGYYDHPPVVAWTIAAGEALFGETPFGVRALFVVMAGLVTLLTWRIALVLSGDGARAFRAALWGKAMLPFAALGFAATPDIPSILFWTAALWALAEAIRHRAPNWWLAVGLFAGLGVLSKFTNLFFGLALVIWLLASREGRRWLRCWQVWAGGVLALLVLAPFLWWNAENGWIGFERQFGRLGVDEGFQPLRMLAFWAALVVLLTPLIAWQAVRGLISAAVPAVLKWLSLPILAYMAWYAFKANAGAQWLMPVFPALAVMAALAARDGWVSRWAAPTGFALSAASLVIGLWPWQVLVPGHNPYTQGRGWGPVVAELRQRAEDSGAKWIATEAYGLTAQLYHHLGDSLPVWSVTFPERYDYRGAFPKALCNAPGLFVTRSTGAKARPDLFAQYRSLGPVSRQSAGRDLMRYEVARIEGVLTRACGPE